MVNIVSSREGEQHNRSDRERVEALSYAALVRKVGETHGCQRGVGNL